MRNPRFEIYDKPSGRAELLPLVFALPYERDSEITFAKEDEVFAYSCCSCPVGCTTAAQQPAPERVIGFMTDFDVKDDAVGICKALMDGIAPGVRVLDITHQSEPYNIAMGARLLAGSAPYFPMDAVFVVVIDPGVSSTRKAIIAKSGAG
jgi:hypothetical protein